jgi:hypothetical protein
MARTVCDDDRGGEENRLQRLTKAPYATYAEWIEQHGALHAFGRLFPFLRYRRPQ